MQQLKPIWKQLSSLWQPPPDLKVDAWADRYRKLSSESSAEAGQWRTDRVPFQREIMQVINDPSVEEVTFIKSAQVGATEVLLNTIGYYIDQEPSTILCIQPSLSMAQAFSKDRLAPMLRDTPNLKGKVKDPRSRDAENTTMHKKFSGGHITLVGANSASGLASRPIRILLCDEVDRYPASAGTEGDPILLGRKRTTTFWNRKIILTSTPTIKGLSRIERAYEESDKRVYKVPCPECNQKQELKWQQITWLENKPETASLSCKHCGAIIPESKKQWMLLNGEWEAQAVSKKVGFHISELYSPFRTWVELVEDFLEAKKSPELLQTFINTTLGECWEVEQGETIDSDVLLESCEQYNHELVPEEVLILTAGIDLQNDRLEVQVIGWADNYEAWVIEYKIIWGNPATQEIWQELDEFLRGIYTSENGRKLNIAATCIDSGHMTDQVYAYTRGKNARRIFAVKGASQSGKPIVSKPTFVGRRKTALFVVGGDTAKEFIHARLKDDKTNLIHFPNTLDDEYFKQLTAERRVPKIYKGKTTLVWKQTRKRNEALDNFCYALAAAYILQPDFERLARLEPQQQKEQNIQQKPSIMQERRRLYRRKPTNFVNSWKE
jgi:phage terminase large subunit GpA-like protein